MTTRIIMVDYEHVECICIAWGNVCPGQRAHYNYVYRLSSVRMQLTGAAVTSFKKDCIQTIVKIKIKNCFLSNGRIESGIRVRGA